MSNGDIARALEGLVKGLAHLEALVKQLEDAQVTRDRLVRDRLDWINKQLADAPRYEGHLSIFRRRFPVRLEPRR